jgi:hypothetical protein
MKSTKRWFELAEYASLGFSALGTIAAAATQQTLYAATPLTITLSLNLLNRQELARRTRQIGNNVTQLEQQFSSNVCSLSTQIQSVENSLNALPHSLEKTGISKLEEIRQSSQQEIVQLREQVNILETSFNNLPASSEPIELDSIEIAIAHLKEQLNSLTEQFKNRLEPKEIEEIKEKFTGLVTYEEFTKIESQINQISTQVQAFSATFDFTSLEEKITEIEASLKNFATSKSFISLADRLEISSEKFNNRPELEEIKKIRERLTKLEPVTEQLEEFKAQLTKLATTETVTKIQAQLTEQLNALKFRLDNLPAPLEPINLTEIEQAIATIESQLATLKPIPEQIAQFQSELSLLRVLDLRTNGIKNQLKELANQFVKTEDLEKESTRLSKQFTHQIEIELEKQIQTFNQLIKENQPAYSYELVFDRKGSRKVLLEALKTAQERLILVCPWITNYGADYEVRQLFENFLRREGILEIGWGHLKDINEGRLGNGSFYNGLYNLRILRDRYPNQFKLKVLGTHEKFLVCDRDFVMLGSHNFLTSGDSSIERELGLKTTDPQIVKKLIERFENAPNLDNESAIAIA